MIDLDRELKIVSLIINDLKPYLLSEQLYWMLSKPGPLNNPFPMGTLGGLFFRLRRLEFSGQSLTPEQFQQLVDLRATMDQQLAHWVAQTEGKAVREVNARLQTWSAYLDDLTDVPHRYRLEYPTQAEGRVIVSLLLDFLGPAVREPRFGALLDSLDYRLRGLVEEGAFVWDASLVSAFPKDLFWWLYVSPHC
ncbi:MAG: hypothetical protein JXB07_16720 [Anaerolineae bacterium]|nr:hypothetical protein [Anaerolineae bacterium]